MPEQTQQLWHTLDETAVLRSLVEGTAKHTGDKFFASLVEHLAQTLGVMGAWITEYLEEDCRLHSLAFWMRGDWIDHFEYDIRNTPCEPVVVDRRLVHVPDRVMELYPKDPDLVPFGAVSYLGVPLLDLNGIVLGHLAVLHDKPLAEDEKVLALFHIFAGRASAELQRLRAEQETREREQKLNRLVDSAMDAIVELDRELRITRLNKAAEKMFGCAAEQEWGKHFGTYVAGDSLIKLGHLVEDLNCRPEGQKYLWIPGGLEARRRDGDAFPAEATLSCYEMNGKPYYTLILRNVNARLEAERRIQTLASEAEYLRNELRALQQGENLLGQSPAMHALLEKIHQVAATDASVLLLGETGTGKEVVARTIHKASRRASKPLIKVNCAAIPINLIESEFFGHEKGAFTGATQRRDGRFALANGGTIFLDEIGELPLDLQAKLLRVLQEGEFEPVGSGQTHNVDVRIIAATNRELDQEIREGRFREDLYYRLNVFPICMPPLRNRGEDVILLAEAFAKHFAKEHGRPFIHFTEDQVRRLQHYDWPGNVRELQNVIERAVITAHGDRLNIESALPNTTPAAPHEPAGETSNGDKPVWTAQELQEQERDNMVRALEATKWKVAGDAGAARLLGMKPSTLTSRMKALGISRPNG